MGRYSLRYAIQDTVLEHVVFVSVDLLLSAVLEYPEGRERRDRGQRRGSAKSATEFGESWKTVSRTREFSVHQTTPHHRQTHFI